VQWQKIRWNVEREYFGIPSAAFHHFCQSFYGAKGDIGGTATGTLFNEYRDFF
jgi:hypothetical protein